MRTSLTMCHVNDTLAVAARRLWNQGCTALPVVREDGKLVGMIDDRAICMAALTQGRPLDKILVNVAMSRERLSAHADDELAIAEDLMAEHQVARIPVVDDLGRPLGIISLSDLAIASARGDGEMRDGFARVGRVLASVSMGHRDRAA